jgi:hypothetical protein
MMLLILAGHRNRRALCNLNYRELYCLRSAVWVCCTEGVFCTPSLQMLTSPGPCMLLISRYLMNFFNYALVSNSQRRRLTPI